MQIIIEARYAFGDAFTIILGAADIGALFLPASASRYWYGGYGYGYGG
jgi:hypothetical protein